MSSVSDNTPPDPLSKSQRKRDMLALQDIGNALIALSEAQLAKIPLPEDLLEALQEARRLKSHEAKRRQAQYIGKMMREVDVTLIVKALKKI